MKDLLVLFAHLLTMIAKLLGPGWAKAIVADSLLMKPQLCLRAYSSLGGDTSAKVAVRTLNLQTTLNNFCWKTHS